VKYEDTILEIIKKYVPKSKVYLFGSGAHKTHTPGSGIDLAIDAGEEIRREEIKEKNIPLELKHNVSVITRFLRNQKGF